MRARWNRFKIFSVTGKTQKAAQLRWFENNLGITPPHDASGLIMNDAVYNDLLKKQCGVLNTATPEQLYFKPKLRNS